ncbi:MAG: 3-deoxy-D-manno-octulosonic acid transferase [Acidobacteriaceae bacterium]
MLVFYSLALLLVLVVGAPWWLFRMATSGKYREGLAERLGFVPHRLLIGKRVIWVHAVSVGEALAASRLIEELSARSGCTVLISTTTHTGQRLARERFGDDRVFYFPLDFAFAVRAYLRALNPCLLVLLETEFWPRTLTECRRAGVPVAVVNARISDRSWPRYRRLRFLWKHLLDGFVLVLAQSETDGRRLEALGASNVRVGGNLKYDIRVAQPSAVTKALREHMPAKAKVVVCGSTLAGEEELLLNSLNSLNSPATLPPDVITILAPRHPERFDAVAATLASRGVPYVRRSQWMSAPAPLAPGTVFLLDSIGELASVYSLASVAVVGGGMFAPGGHNPLEPAQFGVPIVMGPHYENFRGIVERLRAVDAITMARPSTLTAVLGDLLASESEATAAGARARAVFENEAGATARAASALLAVIGEGA